MQPTPLTGFTGITNGQPATSSAWACSTTLERFVARRSWAARWPVVSMTVGSLK
jgi:hypothetical protein